jgi:hemoglobin
VSELPLAGPPRTLYEAVGGEPTFRRLVGRFYALVADDLEILRPLYPDGHLGPAEERLRMFLIQYWGGPQTYTELRGHPRLRMRHSPFSIGPAERDAWMRAMRLAVDDTKISDPYRTQLLNYFQSTADHMVNVHA